MTTTINADNGVVSGSAGLKETSDSSGILALQTNGVTAVTVDASQNVLVTAPSGLGYGTGSGGTVTQLTSKSTAVTLNKPTGKITMNNAALAAGAAVQFRMDNTTVGVNDICVANITNAASSSNYQLYVLVTAASTVFFGLKNETAGSLSDALVINFAIIKGATS